MPEEKKTPTSTNFDLLSAERYRDAIKFLNENGKNYIEINVGHNHNHVVLRVTDQGDSGLPRFFVVNVQPGKGKFGASGYVYDCCCIDQNGSPILNQDPFVAKRFHKGSEGNRASPVGPYCGCDRSRFSRLSIQRATT